jgi:hypothetical protein
MLALTNYEGQRYPTSINEIAWWYEQAQDYACLLPEPERREALERCTGEYYQKLAVATESRFWWLVEILPANLKERMVADQGAWLALRKTRFAALNLLHGLLGGGNKPFDRVALLLAHAAIVKTRGLELEQFYQEFHSRWRRSGLRAVQ